MSEVLDYQVGGDHYDMAIQPAEFILANSAHIGWAEGNVIKYLCGYKRKGGVQDLKKARHYLDMLIEQQSPVQERETVNET